MDARHPLMFAVAIAVVVSMGGQIGCVPSYLKPKQQAATSGPANGASEAPAGDGAPENAEGGETETVKAAVGVGKQGRSLDDVDGVGGIIAQPAKTLFATKERIAFEIQIPHALELYKALQGRAPRNHDEFMREIIKANNIKLPALPDGHEYKYDPETAELMVERPARK